MSPASSLDPRTPVLVGAGQITHRAAGLDDALEPAALMAEAARRAASDAGLGSVPEVDSIRVVNLLSCKYHDPARFVAEQLGLSPRETAVTTPGGNSPQTLVNGTALEILRGDLDIALLAGAEAWRSRMRARKAGVDLPWPTPGEDVQPTRTLGEDLVMNHENELARGVYMPVQVYPMFETALRAADGRTPEEQLVLASELWARFSEVAAGNPHAWLQTARTAEEIRTPSVANRMIGLPYTKLMNSNNDVDMGAALLMCSAETARRLGVPEDRWVFPHSGADCREHPFMSDRWSFTRTPAVELGGKAALDLAGVGIDDIDLIDLYSCFPSAVQLGARSLGLSLDRQLTRTGGLSFNGGPWNNYVMHAIATMMNDLRERPGEKGLVWGNGGYVTKHSFGVYSTTPPAAGFRHAHPQDEIDALPRRTGATAEEAAGPATIEAYTVMHDRDGLPEQGIASCLLPDGRRAWATTADSDTAAAMCDGEWVARPVTLSPTGRLHP
jgi:acetyl-CoA C-acetyltransferase